MSSPTTTAYPTMSSSYSYHPQDQEQYGALVPSYGQAAPTYSNYQMNAGSYATTHPSFAGPPPPSSSYASVDSPTIYTAPQPSSSSSFATTNTADLLDDFISHGGSTMKKQEPEADLRSPTSTMDLPPLTSFTIPHDHPEVTATTHKQLEARDQAFVDSLSPEIIAEQERLLKEIQQRNAAKADRSNVDMTLWDPATHYYSRVVVPKSTNPTGSDAVVPTKYQMKNARKAKMGAGAVGGAVVGGILFGPAWPLGVVAGGAAGAYGSKQIAKATERRTQRKFEKKSVQHQASQSIVAQPDNDATAFA